MVMRAGRGRRDNPELKLRRELRRGHLYLDTRQAMWGPKGEPSMRRPLGRGRSAHAAGRLALMPDERDFWLLRLTGGNRLAQRVIYPSKTCIGLSCWGYRPGRGRHRGRTQRGGGERERGKPPHCGGQLLGSWGAYGGGLPRR